MADRVLQVVNSQVRVSVSGGPLIAALAAQAALPFAERAETAQTAAEAVLAEIAAIELAGSTAPAIAGKADKTVVGINIATIGTPENPANDNTADFLAAQALLPGSHGDVQFPLANWYGNFVLDESAQGIRGRIGEGETGAGGVNALRPYDITKPTVTVTGATGAPVFNNTLRDILISGHKATGQEAPAALRLTAGVSHFFASNIELIGGTISLDCLPADGEPVTCSGIDHFHIRCDVAGADARAIKFTRTGSDGEYFTGFSMHQGHVNGPNGTGSYALEIDGSVVGITASFVDVYFDCKPDKGVLLLGSSLLLGFNLQLDPGTNGVVVVKTDQVSRDPCDYLSGNIRHGGQSLENSLDEITAIPADCEWFFRYAALRNSYLSGLTYISTDPADRFSQDVYLTAVSVGGPVGLYGAPLWAMDATNPTSLVSGALMTQGGAAIAKDIRIGGTWYGYSGSTVAVTQEPQGAGWRVDIAQAGGSYRITPGAGGYFIVAGAGQYPSGDNAQALGLIGNAWSNVVATKYSDAAGVKLLGSQGAAVADAVAAAGAPTQSEFNALVTQFNALLARCRAHGLIAT